MTLHKYDCPQCGFMLDIPIYRGWPAQYGSEAKHVCPGCKVQLYMHGDEGSEDVMMFWLSIHEFPKLIGE